MIAEWLRFTALAGALAFTALATGCDDEPPGPADLGADLAPPDLAGGPELRRVGIKTQTCCVVADAKNERVLYLARPRAAASTTSGGEVSADGELHIASALGGDYVLGTIVPVGGYAFSADDSRVIFIARNPDATYALQIAPLSPAGSPLLRPVPSPAVATRMRNSRLSDQAFFTPSGRYLITGVRAPNASRYADIHVIDVAAGQDVYQIGEGSFAYFEFVSAADVMFYQHLDASTSPGTPSTQGLYRVDLPAAIAGQASPSLIDVRTDTFALRPDGTSVLYTRTNGDLVWYDSATSNSLVLDTGVIDFVAGAASDGPVAYVRSDGSVHLIGIDGAARTSTAPGAAELNSELRLSPDGQHVYFFRNYRRQERSGDLWHLGSASPGPTQPTPLLPRASTRTLRFEGDRLLVLSDASATGEVGALWSLALDGGDPRLLGRGVVATNLLLARPTEGSAAGRTVPVAAIGALLDEAHITPETRPIDGSRALVGTLGLGEGLTTELASTGALGHATTTRVSDDGQAVFYLDGADWDTLAFNYAGTLSTASPSGRQLLLFDAALPRASEIGRVTGRSLFANIVDTQAVDGAGVYFLRY